APETLQRFVHETRRSLAHPQLRSRRDEPRERSLIGIALAVLEGACKSQPECKRALTLKREIREDRTHQRLIDKFLLKHSAVARVMDGLQQRPSHDAK